MVIIIPTFKNERRRSKFVFYSVQYLCTKAKQYEGRTSERLMLKEFLVGLAGFEPATPSSRTRCNAGRPLNDQCFSSTSDPVCSRSILTKLWPPFGQREQSRLLIWPPTSLTQESSPLKLLSFSGANMPRGRPK